MSTISYSFLSFSKEMYAYLPALNLRISPRSLLHSSGLRITCCLKPSCTLVVSHQGVILSVHFLTLSERVSCYEEDIEELELEDYYSSSETVVVK